MDDQIIEERRTKLRWCPRCDPTASNPALCKPGQCTCGYDLIAWFTTSCGPEPAWVKDFGPGTKKLERPVAEVTGNVPFLNIPIIFLEPGGNGNG